MKQLRYLIDVELEMATRTKENNGVTVMSYTPDSNWLIQEQELTDEISASIYGADVNRMFRVSSPHNELEAYLMQRVNNTSDNVSYYTLKINGFRYKIVAVKKRWVDIELL